MTANAPLAHLLVVDMGRGRAASQAALLLAQAGAIVRKIDDVGTTAPVSAIGDRLWNRDKQRESFAAMTGDEVETLLARADILIHDCLPSVARTLGLDADTLGARFPKLVHVAIGAWPAGHPREETPVDDALALAESGLLDEQPAANRDGPVWLRFPLGSALAAYLAASGALARIHARHRTGQGGPVFTSLVQGAMLPMMMYWMKAERPTRSVQFGMPKDSGATLFECADGQWIHTMGAPQQGPTVRAALDAMTPEDRGRHNAKYADAIVKYPGLGDDWGAVEAILKTRPLDYWLAEFWASDVPAQPVLPMGALYTDEQAIAAGYVEMRETPDLGPICMPGAPFHIAATSVGQRAVIGPEAPSRPLEGLRVLDIGNFLAGPLGPMLLGDLGADVVKLEASSGDPLRPVEWAFNGCQRSKRGIAVQLKDPRGRGVMERLIEWADIVHHNQRMPAAVKLGFDAESVHRINPTAIYCHVSSYGQTGPRKDWPGYDQLFQAASGWELEGAGAGNPPMWHRFGMMDHLGALASVVATLAALVARDRDGTGAKTAASLLGASIASIDTLWAQGTALPPEEILDHSQTRVSATRRLLRAADGWVALGGQDRDADPIGELTGGDIDRWAASLTVETLLAQLASRSIPAARVMLDHRDSYLADPANRAATLATTVTHPVYGAFDMVGAAWTFGDLDVAIDRAPPLLGEHSRAILAEIGMPQAEQDALIADGIVVETAAQSQFELR